MFDTFKPNLFPNNKKGVHPNWDERLSNPEEWLYSVKKDGMRVELYKGVAYSRTKKVIKNVQIQCMAKEFYIRTGHNGVIEGEFFIENHTFSEISHFFKKNDVTDPKYRTLCLKRVGTPQWKYPGRSAEWAYTWPKEAKFYLFDWYNEGEGYTKQERLDRLSQLLKLQSVSDLAVLIPHNTFTHIDEFYQAYDQALLDGEEGLMVVKKSALYKYGRYTELAAQGFKVKEDHVPFVGTVKQVLEGTIADPSVEKTVNELGRSVTSKKKDDRLPSGSAESLYVILNDGRKTKVQLSGFTHEDKVKLLQTKWLINKQITFYGMNPTKPGGSPRNGIYSKPKIL